MLKNIFVPRGKGDGCGAFSTKTDPMQLVTQAYGNSILWHVTDFPLKQANVCLKAKEVLVGVRDVLGGHCATTEMGIQPWALAMEQSNAMPHFAGQYLSLGGAAAGFALSLTSLTAAILQMEASDYNIPEQVLKLAGGVPVTLLRIGTNAVDSTFQMISNSYRNSALHRVPHDLDFAKAIEDQATGTDGQSTAKELVAQYQRAMADFPERKLLGNAAWRLVLAFPHGKI